MRFFAFLVAVFAAIVAIPASAQQIMPTEHGKDAPLTTDKSNLWLLDLSTGGRVTILLRPDVAPKMVERIKTLTRQHFYDGIIFHRVIDSPLPIAQAGDPTGTGAHGSDLPDLPAEFNYLPHVRGAVSAARTKDENSANSQFFILFQPAMSLDHKYTVFGRVIDGMQYVDAIHRGEPPKDPSRILHAYIASDNPPAYSPQGPNDMTATGADSDLTLPANKPDPSLKSPINPNRAARPAKKAPATKPAPSQKSPPRRNPGK